MTKPEHLNHAQLRLFMTAGEMMDLPSGDSPDGSSMNQNAKLHEQKLHESIIGGERHTHGWEVHPDDEEDTLVESIREKGVTKPVELMLLRGSSTPVITDGNHRIAAANSINPNMYIIPKYMDLPEHIPLQTSSDIATRLPNFPLSSKKDKE